MAFKIPALDRLITELSRLPGLGEKTAQRLSFHILRSRNDAAAHLCRALLDVKEQVHSCPRCFSFTDQEICSICNDSSRQSDLLCVIEDPSEILRIEEDQ